VALAAAFVGAFFGSTVLDAAAALGGPGGELEAIHVIGATRLSPDQVATATGVSPGTAWAAVDPDAVVEKLEANDWIASATVMRVPPASLVVEIQEHVPLAIVRDASGASWLVDASGTPFAPATGPAAEGLPRLVPAGEWARNQASAALAEAARLAHSLLDHGLPLPSEVKLGADGDAEGYVLRLAGQGARVILGREDLEERIAALAKLLASNVVEAYRSATFDLRFQDQAVLRQLPSPQGKAQEAAARGRAKPSNRKSSG
jgi:cell division protein FtsQ